MTFVSINKRIKCPKCAVSAPAVRKRSSVGRRFTVVKPERFEKYKEGEVKLHCDLCGHRFSIDENELLR